MPASIAVFEIVKAVGMKNKLIMAATIALSAIIPFLMNFGIKIPVAAFGGVYVVLILVLMLIKFEETKFEQAVIAIFASVCIPYSFSLLILFRDIAKYIDEVITMNKTIYLNI